MNSQNTTHRTASSTMSGRTGGHRSVRRTLTLVGTLAAIGAVPAAASASTTWFGSSLNHSPANAGNTCDDNGVAATVCTHVGSYFPGTSGRARAPRNGTITAVKFMAQGPMTATIKVVSIRNFAADHKSGQAKTIAVGPTVQVKGPTQAQLEEGFSPVETFKVKLKVKKGQMIAIDTTANTAEYCADGTPGQLLFGPRLRLNQPFRSSDGVDGCLMLVQAVLRY